MSLSALRQRSAWGALERHYQKMADRHLRQLFAEDRERGERFTLEAAGVYLDYSKNRITDETVKLLLQLAQESGLRERIDAMFRGERINVTEDRAVLHVALRMPRGAAIVVGGADVVGVGAARLIGRRGRRERRGCGPRGAASHGGVRRAAAERELEGPYGPAHPQHRQH